MGIKPMEHVVEWAESGLADWQEGDADSYVSENGHPSWENIMGYVLAAEADISALKQQIELEAIISGLAQDETAAFKRENKRLLKGIKMAHLHLLASRCECGEPLKETDAFDCLDALLTAEEQECEHSNAVSAINEVVKSGYFCPDCNGIFADDPALLTAEEQEDE